MANHAIRREEKIVVGYHGNKAGSNNPGLPVPDRFSNEIHNRDQKCSHDR